MSGIVHQCVDQYACLAANINFNLENLRTGFWQLTIDGLSWGAIYALVAVGYTLVFGVLRLINFAHSEIFMLGMFGTYFALDIILGFTPERQRLQQGHRADDACIWRSRCCSRCWFPVRPQSDWSSSPTGRCEDATRAR